MPRAHRKRIFRSVLGGLLLVSLVAASAQLAGVSGTRAPAPGTHLDLTVADHWLVQLPDGASRSNVQSAARGLARDGSSKVATSAELPGNWYEVRLPTEVSADQAEDQFATAGATDVEAVVPRVTYDEPSAPSTPVESSPALATRATAPAPASPAPAAAQPDSVSDPAANYASASFADRLRSGAIHPAHLAEQWAIDQPSDIDIDGGEAWARTTGSGTIVAVIDTGVDASHPDLAGRVLPGHDFSGADTGATYDAVGHGTAVASIIAAGGTGMAGVSPDARILPLKVYADSEVGFSMSGYLQAIRYAADNGAKVINISLGCGGVAACYSAAERDALAYAANKGVTVVVAAGNGDASGRGTDDDTTPDYPSDYDLPNVISVTSSTRFGGWSTWANYGATTVDIAAPGEDILVAKPGGGYFSTDGTSFSAPHVTGAAALLSAATAGIDPTSIRARLVASATPVPELRNRIVSGGTLNANAALASAAVGGGANSGNTVTATAPANGAKLLAPATLQWRLPAGWSSARVLLSGPGTNVNVPVAARARALAQPAAAWRSGGYRWQVVARSPAGTLARSPWRSYHVAPRLAAWVTSGRIAGRGHELRLRVGYGSTEPSARTRVTVSANGATIHTGAFVTRTAHAHGSGSPRRAWFTYRVRTGKQLQVGARLKIVVQVTSGGASISRTFSARVA
ncbi:MAG: peptidase and in, kexin, sedolisin [Thermoleophilia bacterium]|nr:peptidase and in, kexin, sedolisin [Thermoleophilia bacterium]